MSGSLVRKEVILKAQAKYCMIQFRKQGEPITLWSLLLYFFFFHSEIFAKQGATHVFIGVPHDMKVKCDLGFRKVSTCCVEKITFLDARSQV